MLPGTASGGIPEARLPRSALHAAVSTLAPGLGVPGPSEVVPSTRPLTAAASSQGHSLPTSTDSALSCPLFAQPGHRVRPNSPFLSLNVQASP